MRKNETVFDYILQIAMVYGFTVLCLNLFCLWFGETAQKFSSIFSMGGAGLSVGTMLQFFMVSVIVVTLRFIFFTDGMIKRLPLAIRVVGMFLSVIVVMVLFILWFGWFPVNMWKPWVMFFLCFGLSAGISTFIALLKEKVENNKMDEALQRLKQGE